MVLALAAGGVGLLLVGIFVGWAATVRGPLRWCPRDGEPLRCLVCHPVGVATGRATPRFYGQPPASTVDRPLLTPLAAQLAPELNPRRRRTL